MSTNAPAVAQPTVIPLPTPEEEDQITFARITLDERPLRRMIKKFHNYTSLSHPPIIPVVIQGTAPPTSVDDAREGFLIELATFELLMKKSVMICEAEARQVEEYQREREVLENEHGTLESQIEELKVALEQAQMLRKRKIEYDAVAEKVNTLPSREELESTIASLENDMAAIRSEHDTQNRIIQGHKTALDSIITDLSSLKFMGKEPEIPSIPQSSRVTPAVEDEPRSVESSLTSIITEEVNEHQDNEPPVNVVSVEGDTSISDGMIEEENDIEMGEVEEDPRDKNKKKTREEMEEGEATDASSELSEPPDD